MIDKKFFLIPLFFLTYSSFAQQCNDFKTGTFKIENKETGGSILKRTESTQEETIEKLGIYVRYNLKWTNDCSYILYNRKLIKGNPIFQGNKSDTIFIEITKVYSDGYQFRSTSNFSDLKNLGIAKRKK